MGWTLNLIGMAYVVMTTVLFLFPPALPVDANNMNYCIAAFGIVIVVAGVQWVVVSRKTFTGPEVMVLEGKMEVEGNEMDLLGGEVRVHEGKGGN